MTIHEPLLNSLELSEHRKPSSFDEVVEMVKSLILQDFDREIASKQLYYHTRAHIEHVQRRADIIFEAICPYWQAPVEQDIARTRLLLNLCAVAHDAIQVFTPQTSPHTSRQRAPGKSEALTIEKLLDYIEKLNQQLHEYCVDESVLFSLADISIIKDAIEATICAYDASDKAIYQPALYNSEANLSVVARILALADIGSLGMDGVAAYNHEGALLFLEENPDVIPLILNQGVEFDNSVYETIRQRLLRRARFQVDFANSRHRRFPQEIASFPAEAIPILTNEVFKFLNVENIYEIELSTPTDENTSLKTLIDFFRLKDLINCHI